MAISAATLRGRIRNTSNGLHPYSTNSTAMGANHLAIAFIALTLGTEPSVSSISGYGITWEFIDSFYYKSGSNGGKMFIYAGLTGAGDAGDTLDVDPGESLSGAAITVVELTGDFSGASTAAEAIVQFARDPTGGAEAATSQTPSLGSAPDSNSRSVGCWVANITGSVTFDSDWTQIDNNSFSTPSTLMGVAWRSDAADQTASGSWGGTVFSVGYILEVAEVPATTLSGFNVGMIE